MATFELKDLVTPDLAKMLTEDIERRAFALAAWAARFPSRVLTPEEQEASRIENIRAWEITIAEMKGELAEAETMLAALKAKP